MGADPRGNIADAIADEPVEFTEESAAAEAARPETTQQTSAAADASPSPAANPPPRGQGPPLELDQWELDLEWKRLRGLAGTAYLTFDPRRAELLPHGSHPGLPKRHRPKSRRKTPSGDRHVQRPASGWSLLAWGVLSLGLMAFMCGGVLLGWSYVAGRDELWSLGMPIAVAGQVGLLLGLVLQLERIWQGNRLAADKLEQVDEQLHDLKRTTALLGATHTSAAQAFYAHLSQGAHPQLLLADLKGQLDLLAVKMSENSG
jgi:hypothetical protein